MRHRLARFATAATVALLGACRSGPTPAAGAPDSAATGSASDSSRSDALLLAASKTALPPPGVSPGDLPDPAGQGARLVATYCAQCHNLPAPTMHSATDWPRIVRRMWLRMDRLPASFGIQSADEGSRVLLLNYLQANALQVSGTELPPGPGRAEFAVVCSRCHALPDVKIHSSYDWPAVFMRMERNMERMNVSRPNPDTTSKLLQYLQRVSPSGR